MLGLLLLFLLHELIDNDSDFLSVDEILEADGDGIGAKPKI